jgi:putative peptidoglycan lipid II flippase
VPSAVAFLFLGGVLAALIYQGGAFTAADALYVWVILAGAATGLLASTLGRLYASAFYALRDARTPLRAGLVRVFAGAGLGAVAALVLPGVLGIDAKWGAVGLTIAAGVSGHLEFLILRRGLCRRIGRFALPQIELVKLWMAAMVAGLAATGARLLVGELHHVALAALVIPLFCAIYLAVTSALDIPEAAVLTARLRRRSRP